MKRNLLLLVVLIIASVMSVKAWDGKGHSAIAHIAEKHLSPAAKEAVAKYYNGKSLAFYASWMDKNRHCPGYEMTHKWHVDYWDPEDHFDANGNPARPICVRELENIIAAMQDYRNLSDSAVVINLKCITHMVGDMHCPVHVHFSDKGHGHSVIVKKKKTSLHKMWDGLITDRMHHTWSPLYYPYMLDRCSDAEREAIQKGSVEEWYTESFAAADAAYALTPADRKITQDYYDKAIVIIDAQILKAGYRLAAVLNQIFDK